jgi:hypothetical protein
MGLRQPSWQDWSLESRRSYWCLCHVSIVCCQAEVSALVWSLFQKIPNECGVSVFNCESSIKRTPWFLRGCCAMKKLTDKTSTLRVLGKLTAACQYLKCKAIPLQDLTDSEVSRSLSLPDFKTIGTCRWQGCQPYAPAAFIPRKYSWYSFLLETESTPEPQCGRKDYFNEKFQWHHRESIPQPSGL